ncbi:hydroxymethylbilane synthase [Maribacter sp. TH_r10]|uniref:Hydroxymethylbilane synthase n=1 Tax=Maribacter luteus TaxID=2594478 RepID=A0A6I2MN00_9FLAO|nr:MULTISPECIES: hydroxymethylbilane synthase [Maribacter]MDV7137485.1 hydroxymethylbilane synthase [Maribacter sp. TH_r10]MRX64207.1 hydroxymethylbilane synthase [Maribacter luteus]
MSKIIRIGTRDSELALWQANTVKDKLEELGYQTALVPVKSTGDLVLNKPLYEMGITGIFTKTLDVAMLNGDIDIAVHSMKDVPTALPKGIVQAAVLKRANYLDILAFKDNEEFLGSRDAVIATGSLRRKAQWLNRYPTHTVVDIRGNVNSRMQKLNDNDWNGAIFAAAGLDRIGLEHEHTIGLTWMLPAPAQGAIMVVALEDDDFVREACAELNHEPTATCTQLEREFLRLLEGGCSAPIGALAYINNEDEVTMKGVLLAIDGTKKLEAEFSAPLGQHENLGRDCANSILSRGGKNLMGEIQRDSASIEIFSTKKLTQDQRFLFKNELQVDSEDFVKTSPNRIPAKVLKAKMQNVIITSQNAVEALLTNVSAQELQFENIYCVGRRTRRLIEDRIGKVKHFEKNAKKLAEHMVDHLEGTEVTFFCSNMRMDDVPDILTNSGITVNEIEAYKTKFTPVAVPENVKAVLFFSPSTIESYLELNTPDKQAYCIGESTAKEARKHFSQVLVAKIPSVESVVDLVNDNYKN